MGRGTTRGRPIVEGWLWPAVRDKLAEGWSPEQISGWLRTQFPFNPELWVSHETIYQAVYYLPRGAMRDQVTEQIALRTGRRARRPQSRQARATRGNGKPWTTGFHVSDRTPEAADRAVPGHWEGDLIIGARAASAVITLCERQTRFVMLGALAESRASEDVIPVLIELMRTLPQHLASTLTWDQGAELAGHRGFTLATDCKVYFCDPHAPWQRGTNENTNGLIRQYLPKSTDLRHYTQADLDEIAHKLNTRPRKTLDWATPTEAMSKLLVATTT